MSLHTRNERRFLCARLDLKKPDVSSPQLCFASRTGGEQFWVSLPATIDPVVSLALIPKDFELPGNWLRDGLCAYGNSRMRLSS